MTIIFSGSSLRVASEMQTSPPRLKASKPAGQVDGFAHAAVFHFLFRSDVPHHGGAGIDGDAHLQVGIAVLPVPGVHFFHGVLHVDGAGDGG